MIRLRPIAVFVALLGVAPVQGCGLLGGEPAESPVQVQERRQQDEAIRREVEARLAAEPSIGAGRLRAVVNAGDVQLHGAVVGFGALQCAIANAELVPGVRLVIDYMVLQPGPRRVTCLAPRIFSAPATP
ncbi:MAG TPA: BON domain-containing protein [Longimicrobium sp.]|nr:BON domain-containing protein [Longimicrobium sp.]